MKHRFRAGLETLRVPQEEPYSRFWSLADYHAYRKIAVMRMSEDKYGVPFNKRHWWYPLKTLQQIDAIVLNL